MRFTLDNQARSSLYQQIKDQIRYAISLGELSPGDALPSIREVEANFDVNRNTVRRAYLELQAEGSLILRQGREAIVAERPRASSPVDQDELASTSASLASQVLQRAEASGLDSVQFAEHLTRLARIHDSSYPRCAFVECSQRQADYFARCAERRLGRHVAGIDLHGLRGDPATMPSSVRHVFAPHWHIAEANELLGSSFRTISALEVQITAECGAELRALPGASIGLVVRDAESAPGFREILRTHMGRASIHVALSGDGDALRALAAEVDHIVHTSPCAEAVQSVAPPRVSMHELVFEPTPEDLDAIRESLFPPLIREHAPA